MRRTGDEPEIGNLSPDRGSSEKEGDDPSATAASTALYFFPDREVSEEEARRLLEEGSDEERAEVVSHLLRYAQWDDIWRYVSREEVREIFPTLELPENLRAAWARMLRLEAPVG